MLLNAALGGKVTQKVNTRSKTSKSISAGTCGQVNRAFDF